MCFCRRHTSGCRLLRTLSQLLRTLSQLLRTLSKVLRSSGQLLRTLGQTSKKFALTSKNLVSEVCPAPTVEQLLKSGCSFDALGPAVAHAVQICTWGVNVLKIANLRRFLPGMLQHCVYLVCMCVEVYIYIYILIEVHVHKHSRENDKGWRPRSSKCSFTPDDHEMLHWFTTFQN